MGDILYSVKKRNYRNGYEYDGGESKKDVNSIVSGFIQELITKRGSCLFNDAYGTTFIEDLGDQVNKYKTKYLIENNYDDTKKKYDILRVEVPDTSFSREDGFLNIHLNIFFSRVKVETNAKIIFSGSFTSKTIIEVET